MVVTPASHPERARHPILGPALFLMWLALGAVMLAAWTGGISGPVRSYTLSASNMRHDKGCAYIAPIEKRPLGWPLLEFTGDFPGHLVSRLLLSDDGLPVPNGHASHKLIALSGVAGYSHWGQELWFAAGDCSDPRSNGRRYRVSIPLSPSLLAFGLGLLAWLYLVFALTRHCSGDFLASTLCRTLRTGVDLLFAPVDLVGRPQLAAGIAFAMLLVTWGYLVWIWTSGTSNFFALAGFFPHSDAQGYWSCAKSLLDIGKFEYQPNGGDWCQRRAVYPVLLAGMELLSGRRIWLLLVLQSTLVTAAMLILLRRLSSHIPAIATFACAVLLFTYATGEVFSLTMTENAGMIFGCLALALLLGAVERHSLPWFLIGSALMSIALSARVGAIFVLPALVVWVLIFTRRNNRYVWSWVAAAAIACLAGLALQVLLVRAVGGDPSASFGNFSQSLYGLAVGGKGWYQIHLDHPEVFNADSDISLSRSIYALAWEHMRTEPGLMFAGLAKYTSTYLDTGTLGFDRLGHFGPIAKFFWWLAWFPMILRLRDPRCLLIALMSLGIAISAPFLMDDSGTRVFAATVAVDSTQIAIGIATVFIVGVITVTGLRGPGLEMAITGPSRLSAAGFPVLEATGALLALMLLVLPFTPLAQLGTQQPVVFSGCGEGQDAVATRINRGGNVTFSIVGDGQPADFLRGEIAHDNFRRGLRPTIGCQTDLLSLDGGSLILAYRLQADDDTKPGPYRGYADENLARYDGRLVGLCLDNRDTKVICGRTYGHLRSVTELEPPRQ